MLMMSVSFNSNTTDVTCGTGTANPSGADEFTRGFNGVRFDQYVLFCVMFCQSLFVILSCIFCWLLYYMSFFVLQLYLRCIHLNRAVNKRTRSVQYQTLTITTHKRVMLCNYGVKLYIRHGLYIRCICYWYV